MGHKRKPTSHQKQIRFLGILFGAIMVVVVVVVLVLLNRPPGGYH
jgi:t-SNARE complex subunit (syntaxin)